MSTKTPKTIKPGRAAMLTDRDLELLRALAFCPLLTAEQVFRLDLPGPDRSSVRTAETRAEHRVDVPPRGFINKERARQQLYRLERKGYLTKHKAGPSHPTMWRLSHEGYKSIVGRQLRLEEVYGIHLPYNDYEPDPTRARHYNTLAEIFVAVQPLLTDLFGELPNWDWWSERRAFHSIERGSQGNLRYMPDAELHIDGIPLIIERQTKDARKTREDIHKKVVDHTNYHTRSQQGRPALRKDQFHILFACDLPRDAEAARQAGDAQGVQLFADTPNVAIQYIYELAHQRAARNASIHETPNQELHQNSEPTPLPSPVNDHRRGEDNLDLDLDHLEEAAF